MKKGSSRGYILSYLIFSVIFSLLLLMSIFIISRKSEQNVSINDYGDSAEKKPTIIIDAGHGGEDGGAVGKNGVYEKELNLLISEDLCDMLRAAGFEVVMTRESDVLLYDRNVDYKGRKKMLDLAARAKIAENTENCIFISIHMNSFPQEQYRGLQVYYSKNNDSSSLLAENIQGSVSSYLQKDNTRKIKSASKNIYLLDRISSPAVLVECGFLSNPEECALLCEKEYRQKLTFSLFYGISSFLSEYNP
ncbi:MAG: N-acetylmuramoyl-L-alanine amidase [Ruminococcaceae bacterium]|nr:N-acetylmuramoyl-L-alanine amidase [Oscillospiraceae bacterium]